MKKLFLTYIIGLFLFTGCQKNEVDLLFDDLPEKRMNERMSELRTKLLDAPNGWKASLNTSGKGGYGFYLNFKPGMNVEMLSDLNATTGTQLSESTYRVIWAMNASLVFDTFNYITMLQEPSSSYGGTSPNGYQSDIEFEYIKSANDSIYLRGKKYMNDFILVKASAEEKSNFLAGKMNELRTSLISFFQNKFNNYIDIEGISNKVEINFNTLNKTYTAQYIDSDGSVKSFSGKFNFDANGLNSSVPIVINGKIFERATLIDGIIKMYDSTGKEYVVKQNLSPILPIENVYGYNKTYKNISTTTSALPAISITSEFTSVWNTVVSNFVNSGRSVRYFELKFEGARSMIFNLYYAAGATNYTASVTFDYNIENGIITLSNPTGHTSGNWNTRRAQIQPLETYLFNLGPAKIDWVPNNDGQVIGGFYSTTNSNNVFYGFLK